MTLFCNVIKCPGNPRARKKDKKETGKTRNEGKNEKSKKVKKKEGKVKFKKGKKHINGDKEKRKTQTDGIKKE